MTTFSDTFDRANGAPGGNWVTLGGTPSIETNWLRNTAAGLAAAYDTTLNDSGRHECVGRFQTFNAASGAMGPLVKVNPADGTFYLLTTVYTGGVYYLSLRSGTTGSNTQIAATQLASSPPGIVTLRLVWDNGHLTGSISTGETVEFDDSIRAAGVHMGVRVYQNTGMCDWVTMIVGAQPAFDASPAAIPNYGETTEVTFTGTNTEWTSGTPGSPTFTVDHGTLSAQTVASATSASATYDPGDYLGTVVFTDPSTGLTDTCVVSSDIGVIPPGYGALPQAVIDYLQRSADAEEESVIANRNMVISQSGPSITLTSGMNQVRLSVSDLTIEGYEVPDTTNLVQVLMELWRGLNGTLIYNGTTYLPDNTGSVKEDTDVVRTSLTAFRGPLEWTVPGILAAIQGGDDRDLSVVYDLIEAQGAGSNQDVLDALAAYFGANPPTIAQLGTMISDLATVAGYTLGDVLDQIAVSNQALTSLGTAVGVIGTNVETGFAAVLDAIAGIQPGSGTAGAPVWPGLANVTLGSEVALTDQLVLNGPMHGIVVAVTTPPVGLGGYNVGGHRLDYGQMRCAFVTDRGDIEPWQYFGFRTAIYTPKSMEQADACYFQLAGGLGGTVRTWVRS